MLETRGLDVSMIWCGEVADFVVIEEIRILGLCPANRLLMLADSTFDESEPKVKLRRAHSIHNSTRTSNPHVTLQKGQLRRTASSLSGYRPSSLPDTRTCSPGTYDTPPSPRLALRASPPLEYDVPRPPSASDRSPRTLGAAIAPSPPPRRLIAAERSARAAELSRNGDVGLSGARQPGNETQRNSSELVGSTALSEMSRVSSDDLTGSSNSSQAGGTKLVSPEPIRTSDMSFEEQERQMNAVLDELLACVKADKPRVPSPPSRWQGNRSTVSSARPESDNVDSIESSPMTSPCSSQRFSDSTSSSWAMATSIGPTAAPPAQHTAAPSVSHLTLLRLEREVLCALRRLQAPCQCPSVVAAALSFQLNVTRLHSALQDLLLFIDCATGTAPEQAALERALKPLRDASRQLDRAVSQQDAAGWTLESSDGSREGGDDGIEDLQTAVMTLTSQLPLFGLGGANSFPSLHHRSLPNQGHCLPPLFISPSDGDPLSSFQRSQSGCHRRQLREALGQLMRAAHDRQPVSVLPALCKFVVLSAHRLVMVGDEVGAAAGDCSAGWRTLTASDRLFVALRRTLSATKAAAAGGRNDSCDAVREMADATQVLAEAAAVLDRHVNQYCAAQEGDLC
ncbi:uncharacterized protein LOC122389331 isoform X2 [Amphibalanus amphitrite]|uniref:uncharacterized protein LOC122389331 isoform X2 n=1 Tax=Amphibalanus amphitrite TaxID=1232801 RepID=UPI001C90C260|nr:uncharacterized protein LOC122389331 isoform X2 [Amphibalanus amphitrite]